MVRRKQMSNFVYYKVSFKLRSPMLGTATDTSIYFEHVLEKAKKEIKQANILGSKVSKALDKYQGSDISDDKTVAELQGVIRTFCQLMGKPLDVPGTVEEILAKAKELEAEFEEQLKSRDQVKATVFLRDNEGKPIISTHMILGNLKENTKIMVNNGDKSIMKSKVSVGEAFALDVKFVEAFMVPSNDILRAKNQKEADALPSAGKGKNTVDGKGRVLLERPIKFDRMGKVETAIAMSEQLPAGTEFSATMRVRKGSPMSYENLRTLLDLGKSNGFGSWRGSGNMGAYIYKLEELPEYVEAVEEGWS
jgi:hypothetical protein